MTTKNNNQSLDPIEKAIVACNERFCDALQVMLTFDFVLQWLRKTYITVLMIFYNAYKLWCFNDTISTLCRLLLAIFFLNLGIDIDCITNKHLLFIILAFYTRMLDT